MSSRNLLVLASAVALLGLIAVSAAQADTGLVMGCKDADSASKGSGGTLAVCASRQFVKLEADAFVMSAATQDLTAGKYWATESQRYRKAQDGAAAFVVRCSADVAVGSPDCTAGAWTANALAGSAAPVVVPPVVAPPASAVGTAQLTWSPPTQNTDGSALTNLAGYRIYTRLPGAAFALAQDVKNPGINAFTLTGLPVGLNDIAMSAYSTAGTESVQSNVGTKAVLAPPPSTTTPLPPTGLKVADIAAFDVVKSNDKITLAQIGTVPAGTACNSAYQVNGLYLVPRAKVALSGATRPQVVVARCQ